jgi:hypothetical protein
MSGPRVQRDHVGRRIENTPDETGKSFERRGFLVIISMPVINALDAGNCAPQHRLGNVRLDPGPAHERARGAPQIMDDPRLHESTIPEHVRHAISNLASTLDRGHMLFLAYQSCGY